MSWGVLMDTSGPHLRTSKAVLQEGRFRHKLELGGTVPAAGLIAGFLEILRRATNRKIDSLTPAAWAAGKHLPVVHAVA
jgi:hypothetical protein